MNLVEDDEQVGLGIVLADQHVHPRVDVEVERQLERQVRSEAEGVGHVRRVEVLVHAARAAGRTRRSKARHA